MQLHRDAGGRLRSRAQQILCQRLLDIAISSSAFFRLGISDPLVRRLPFAPAGDQCGPCLPPHFILISVRQKTVDLPAAIGPKETTVFRVRDFPAREMHHLADKEAQSSRSATRISMPVLAVSRHGRIACRRSSAPRQTTAFRQHLSVEPSKRATIPRSNFKLCDRCAFLPVHE